MECGHHVPLSSLPSVCGAAVRPGGLGTEVVTLLMPCFPPSLPEGFKNQQKSLSEFAS